MTIRNTRAASGGATLPAQPSSPAPVRAALAPSPPPSAWVASIPDETLRALSTRDRIVAFAYEIFSRHGFHMVGLDRILADAGVSKQTFYNHFESRDDLILAVLAKRSTWELQSLRTMLRERGGDDPRAQILAIFDVLDVWLNAPDFRGCIFMTAAAEFPSHRDPAHQAACDHANAIMALLEDLAARAGANDPKGLSQRIHMLLDGALVTRHVTGLSSAAIIARDAAAPLFDRYLPARRSRAKSSAR